MSRNDWPALNEGERKNGKKSNKKGEPKWLTVLVQNRLKGKTETQGRPTHYRLKSVLHPFRFFHQFSFVKSGQWRHTARKRIWGSCKGLTVRARGILVSAQPCSVADVNKTPAAIATSRRLKKSITARLVRTRVRKKTCEQDTQTRFMWRCNARQRRHTSCKINNTGRMLHGGICYECIPWWATWVYQSLRQDLVLLLAFHLAERIAPGFGPPYQGALWPWKRSALPPQFWLLPIHSELRRAASGLVKVLCKPNDSTAGGKGSHTGKPLKQGGALAKFNEWFGSTIDEYSVCVVPCELESIGRWGHQ